MIASIEQQLAHCESHLPGWKADGDAAGLALCQDHPDKRPSLRVMANEKGGWVTCHSCSASMALHIYLKKHGYPDLPFIPDASSTFQPGPKPKPASKKYVYTGKDGPVLRVTRKDLPDGSKKFFQERYEAGQWVPGGVKSKSNPLYNVHILKNPKMHRFVVFIVEGEKCADLGQGVGNPGFIATTAPMGAGNFGMVGKEYLALLKPFQTKVILPDQDRPGFNHALDVGNALEKEGMTCSVLLLPGLPPKGDVADWLTDPRNADPLLALVHKAIPFPKFRERFEDWAGVFPKDEKGEEESDKAPMTWEQPLRIDLSPVRPSFPLDAFPPVLAVYAQQVSESIQVPTDVVALDILSTLGTVLQKRVDLDTGKGAIFPLNIWTLSVYPSGGGKSRALTETSYPLAEWEQLLQDKAAQKNEESQAERQEPEQRIAELLKNKARSSDEETELRQLRGRLKDFAEVPMPDIYSTDLTQEALLMAMAQNDGCHSVLSAEASDFFQIMAGRYAKEGQSSFGFFVSAYSQELIKNKRAMNGAKSIIKPTLSMGLSVQPSVFEKITANRDFVTRGLPARFLMAYPKDMRGDREVDPPAITDGARRDYNAMVRSLTHITPSRDARKEFEPYQVGLKMEARQAFVAFRRWAEESMRANEAFAECKEFAARMSEHLAKVVGILHCSLHPDQPWDTCVDLATVENAARIVRWSAEHVLTTAGMGGTAEMQVRAAYLYERIASQDRWLKAGVFSLRDLQQISKRSTRYKSGGIGALRSDLAFLEELGYVQRDALPESGRKSSRYMISPYFSENGPQGPQCSATPTLIRDCEGTGPVPSCPKSPQMVPNTLKSDPTDASIGDRWDSMGQDSSPRNPLSHNGLNAIGDRGDQNGEKVNQAPISPHQKSALATVPIEHLFDRPGAAAEIDHRVANMPTANEILEVGNLF